MLLPRSLQKLSGAFEPMVTTDIARQVSEASTEFLGHHGGIIRLLRTNSYWVNEYEAFARLIVETLPGAESVREARAVAGNLAGLYIPDMGVFINGALIAGQTPASIDICIDSYDVAARTALHLTHETAGHAYITENTHIGQCHRRRSDWRRAVSSANSIVAMDELLDNADNKLAEISRQVLIASEGWAHWVTAKLCPAIGSRLPDLKSLLCAECKRIEDLHDVADAQRLLHDLPREDIKRARAAFDDLCNHVLGPEPPVSPRALGVALFREIEEAADGQLCIEAVHDAFAISPGTCSHRILFETFIEAQRGGNFD